MALQMRVPKVGFIKSFRLDVGDENITVNFGRGMPPEVVRKRVLQALDAMLPKTNA